MKRTVVLGLLLIIFFILLTRRRDYYTDDQYRKLMSFNSLFISDYTGLATVGILCDIVLAQLNGTNSKDNINVLLGNVETAVASMNKTITLQRYQTEAEVSQVFSRAYSQGETGMNDRDKLVLRMVVGPCIGIVGSVKETIGDFSYTSDGRPDFADSVISSSGKTPLEIIVFGFTIIKILYGAMSSSPSGNPGNPSAATMEAIRPIINNILPSGLAKYNSGQEILNEFNNQNQLEVNASDRLKFWGKAYVVGAAYIAWLAENKWKLDLDWNPVTSPASSPQ